MKRKGHKPEPVVPAGMLEEAARSASSDGLKKVTKCRVCGSDAPKVGDEPLCWVCRRLKISAWRESEQQMPVQE